MSDYNWNESNYDPKTKDNVFNNDTTFSKKRFGELVAKVNKGGGIQTLSGNFSCETQEISSAVDEPAVLYATQIIYLDQTGYEVLEGGSQPQSGHWEYAGDAYSSILVHDSSSFTTLPIGLESSVQVPYAIALSTGTDQYASGYKLKTSNIIDWPYGGAVKVSDLLAAGESGVKLTSTGEIPYGDGTIDVYASFSSLAEDPTNPPPYVVSYSARKDAVTEDVLTAKIDGKDGSGETVSSVDVSPLLNYIGGRVEEVPVGDSEMLPLVDSENPGVEPPFFSPDFDFINSGSSIIPDTYTFSNGVLTVSFSASSPEPESFVPFFVYGDPSAQPSVVYTKLDSSAERPVIFSLETALAGPIVLDEFDASSNSSDPTGNTVSLVTERVEDDVPAYSFTLYSGSSEMKKVLRLYPSCNGNIDLSGLQTNCEQTSCRCTLGWQKLYEGTFTENDIIGGRYTKVIQNFKLGGIYEEYYITFENMPEDFYSTGLILAINDFQNDPVGALESSIELNNLPPGPLFLLNTVIEDTNYRACLPVFIGGSGNLNPSNGVYGRVFSIQGPGVFFDKAHFMIGIFPQEPLEFTASITIFGRKKIANVVVSELSDIEFMQAMSSSLIQEIDPGTSSEFNPGTGMS